MGYALLDVSAFVLALDVAPATSARLAEAWKAAREARAACNARRTRRVDGRAPAYVMGQSCTNSSQQQYPLTAAAGLTAREPSMARASPNATRAAQLKSHHTYWRPRQIARTNAAAERNVPTHYCLTCVLALPCHPSA